MIICIGSFFFRLYAANGGYTGNNNTGSRKYIFNAQVLGVVAHLNMGDALTPIKGI